MSEGNVAAPVVVDSATSVPAQSDAAAQTAVEGEGKNIADSLRNGGTQPAVADTPAPEGETPADWRVRMGSGLDSDIAEKWGNISSKYSTEQELAKSVVHREQALSRRIPVPDADAPQEAWDEVFTKLGRPEKPEEYQFNWTDDSPKLSDFDSNAMDEFRPVAHQLGLSQKQIDGLTKWNGSYRKMAFEADQIRADDTNHENITALRSEWGGDFDSNVQIYDNTVRHYAQRDYDNVADMRLADGSYLNNNPAFVRMMTRIGRDRVNDDWDINPINQSRKQGAAEELAALDKELVSKNITFDHPDFPREKRENLIRASSGSAKRSPHDKYKR